MYSTSDVRLLQMLLPLMAVFLFPRRWKLYLSKLIPFHTSWYVVVSFLLVMVVLTFVHQHCFSWLCRSESFANDAGILAKLNSLKMDPANSGSGESQKTKPQSGLNKLGQSRMFRRGSLNLRKLKEAPTISDSCESSSENLGMYY